MVLTAKGCFDGSVLFVFRGTHSIVSRHKERGNGEKVVLEFLVVSSSFKVVEHHELRVMERKELFNELCAVSRKPVFVGNHNF